ncbi:ATP-binding cassette domain-containing protein [Mesoplasma corruscae]|uniref:Vga family ABC-F type ribosomal protection protein n=1 Tax=Mesoplasma corruscae TaxID=216874 RepID=A0A2S5RHL3_9MOLU|nr:ATP-binding cassette domain-containing protein [Mesoplasma corruscae]PPE06801.1 Vga family ABC-F type ribosomal protection protein [Mesoplasma corruscae]
MIQINNFKLSQNEQFLFKIQKLQINNNNQIIALIGNNGVGKTSFAKAVAKLEHKFEGVLTNTFKTNYIEQKYFVNNNNMSGGEYSKTKILEAFMADGNFLILDEPTVNLDRNNFNFLIKKMKCFKGVILLITHDRELIQKTANEILEIEDNELKYYKTNFKSYIFEKENQAKQHNINIEKYKLTKKQLEKDITTTRINNHKKENGSRKLNASEKKLQGGSGKSSMSKKLGSLKTKLSKLDKVNDKYILNKKISFEFEQGLKRSEILYLNKYNFMINNHDKIALTGQNGSGKTTLMNLIYSQLSQLNNPLIKIGFLHQVMDHKLLNLSVKDFIDLKSYESRTIIRGYLSQFKYTDLMYLKKVRDLSEGEKVQLNLSAILSVPTNILLLDEPTNYLDLNSIIMLEFAIKKYEGTIIIVSHDQVFIENTCNKTLNLDLYKDK